MRPIVIVTDSAADIDDELRSELGIECVSLKVIFGKETYVDWVTIKPSTFYQKLRATDVMPSTSQPSPLDFTETYKRIAEQHGRDVQIIALILSGALSGTYQSAVIGKSMLEDDLDITVIDTKKASFIHGMVAVEAAKAVRQGKNKQQVLDLIAQMLEEIQVYFLVDTLTYLQKGGRIGRASALIGSLLNIKPILSLDPGGTVYPFDKVRGTKKAIARIMEELAKYAGDAPVKVTVGHADARAEAEELLERTRNTFQVTESRIIEIGPVIGTHVGPGTLAVFMIKE